MPTLLDRLSKLRILVVGDLMLDHYIWGDVHRISPEAPVPVVRVANDTWTAGGAANVALNLAGLGVEVAVLGHIGSDGDGARLGAILQSNNVRIHDVPGSHDAPTIVKTRVIARNQQLCRIDRESQRVQRTLDPRLLADLIHGAVQGCQAVIVSDYAKGLVTQQLLDELRRTTSENGILLSLDPKPSRQLDLRGIGLLTPNRAEALQMAGADLADSTDPFPLDDICRSIHRQFAPSLLALTLGPDGMVIASGGEVQAILATEAREVFDVSGAGDTVIACLTAALAAGEPAAEAAAFANRAAGIVVGHVGTAPITRRELERI
jgi:D-glycero-beta-D-manno-heptose-7-phosphate kinase